MSSINTVVLVGRLTADPEGFGDGVGCNMRLAVDRAGKEQGSKEPVAGFFNVTAFGKGAEFTLQYLGKGSLIGVEGYLQHRTYERKDGGRAEAVDVIANRVQSLGSKADNTGAAAALQQRKPKPAQGPDTAWVDEEEDPFGDQ